MDLFFNSRSVWDTSVVNWRTIDVLHAPDTDLHQYVLNDTVGHPTRDCFVARLVHSRLIDWGRDAERCLIPHTQYRLPARLRSVVGVWHLDVLRSSLTRNFLKSSIRKTPGSLKSLIPAHCRQRVTWLNTNGIHQIFHFLQMFSLEFFSS